MNQHSKIFVAGHKGLAGSAIRRALEQAGFNHLIFRDRRDLDLTQNSEVRDFFKKEKPEYVFLAAAKVGGILANSTYPADFLHQNLSIQNNVIHSAYEHGVKRLLFLGSSCIYPRLCPQPIKEDYLLTGPLEPTNEAYAIAKIAGIKMCQTYNRQYGTEYLPVMPTNLYGPNDNYNLETSHVLPALIRKFHEAKINQSASVILWGTGKPRREFLHADDLASACLFLMTQESSFLQKHQAFELVNIGTGSDMTIGELAHLIQDAVGFKGKIEWDISKPDGTPQKLLDVGRINQMGWNSSFLIKEKVKEIYSNYLKLK